MATVTPTYTPIVSGGDGSVVQFSFALTTANPDGSPVEFAEYADYTIVASGTWGGATLKIQGSADGSTFIATGLSSAAGGAEAAITGDKVATIIERPRYIRPILTTVGSGAAITVTITLRRGNPMRT